LQSQLVPRGQATAQRELAVALENALEARRQRIIVSQSQVNVVKSSCLIVEAICSLLVIALVHSHDRMASTITMGVFATGVAACVLLIAAHDRPFTGQISPDALLQVMPVGQPRDETLLSRSRRAPRAHALAGRRTRKDTASAHALAPLRQIQSSELTILFVQHSRTFVQPHQPVPEFSLGQTLPIGKS
jgi:hypothetical protein